MKVINLGSLNIDHVYGVEHIARPGETIASSSYRVFAGGKGANQSAALARAGAKVCHAGRVGPDGRWLVEQLAAQGVDMQLTEVDDVPTGHAIIQVEQSGENAIILHDGANARITTSQITRVLSRLDEGDILLLQNEINDVGRIIQMAGERQARICFNPAPFDHALRDYALDRVDTLILNEREGMGLVGAEPTVEFGVASADDLDDLFDRLISMWPKLCIIFTMGAEGIHYYDPQVRLRIPAAAVTSVDTTGAGDTFIGYYLAGKVAGKTPRDALTTAIHAAALCVTRPGAMDSIPAASDVEEFLRAGPGN